MLYASSCSSIIVLSGPKVNCQKKKCECVTVPALEKVSHSLLLSPTICMSTIVIIKKSIILS